MNRHLTDEQRQLVADNHNLIYGFLNKYNLPDDEWYDVAAFGLINAALTYTEGAKFSTYAYKCMFNEMRNEFVWRNRYLPDILSLDYEYESNNGDVYTLADVCPGEEDFTAEIHADQDKTALLLFFESKLKTDCQRQQLKLLAEGISPPEVARRCNVSKQSVYQFRENLAKEYRTVFADDGSIRPAEVGGKIRIANNPYLYTVMSRDERYIICTRTDKRAKDYGYYIIDLKDRIYGTDGGEIVRYHGAKNCIERLKELQTGVLSISETTIKKLDFYVA